VEPDQAISMGQVAKLKKSLLRLRLPGKLMFLFRIRIGLYARAGAHGCQTRLDRAGRRTGRVGSARPTVARVVAPPWLRVQADAGRLQGVLNHLGQVEWHLLRRAAEAAEGVPSVFAALRLVALHMVMMMVNVPLPPAVLGVGSWASVRSAQLIELGRQVLRARPAWETVAFWASVFRVLAISAMTA